MNGKLCLILLRWSARLLAAFMLCTGVVQADGAEPNANFAALLRAKYAELRPQLSANQFNRPLHLDSVESSSHIRGEVYAVIDYPFATVSEALIDPMHWCDVLILHLNTKYCHATINKSGSTLMVSVGKKYFQSLDQAYPVEFAYSLATRTPEYFDVRLVAQSGPLGTSDYRITLEAVTIETGKTFLHLTYSYSYGLVGRLAMQAYLLTAGSEKVGFTRTANASGSQPLYIGGVRAAVERNTMRYYLAIDAYLGALSTPQNQQVETRLKNWFASTEQYAVQLHEIDLETYLDMKRKEYLRMQKSP